MTDPSDMSDLDGKDAVYVVSSAPLLAFSVLEYVECTLGKTTNSNACANMNEGNMGGLLIGFIFVGFFFLWLIATAAYLGRIRDVLNNYKRYSLAKVFLYAVCVLAPPILLML